MASAHPLCSHPALEPLPPKLREIVAVWVEDLAKASLEPDPLVVLQNLDNLVFGHSASARALPAPDLDQIQEWLDDREHEAPIKALAGTALQAAGKTRRIPQATPEQIKIILEAQEEVGVFWTRAQLEEMTRWQADTVIKGLMVRSEVRRFTGTYDYPIRRLRHAVRSELTQLNQPEFSDEERSAERDARNSRWPRPVRAAV